MKEVCQIAKASSENKQPVLIIINNANELLPLKLYSNIGNELKENEL